MKRLEYRQMAIDSVMTVPSSSTSAGTLCIGLSAVNASLRCSN
jgi:hypothetical protein